MMPFAPIYDVYQLIRNFGMQLLWERKILNRMCDGATAHHNCPKNQWSTSIKKGCNTHTLWQNYSGARLSRIKKQFHDLVKNELFNVTLSTFQLYLSRLNHDT
jgi:hypothetical protein